MSGLPQDKFTFIPCDGGCDFVTPPMMQKPGRLRSCVNLEIGLNGGYDTVAGYERYDGRTSPSSATYTVLPANITGTVAVGNTVTGATSAATGKVIAVEAAAIIVTQVTGTFVNPENLTVSASVQAAINGAPSAGGASTALLNATYLNLAADVYRALITTVTGSGPIRGVCRFNGVLYAWRNNAGGTAMEIYKSSSSGWTAVALGREIAFTLGGLKASTGTVTLTGGGAGSVNGITVNGVQIMSGAVAFTTSLANTASLVAANINAFETTPVYTAEAVGTVITITADAAGSGTVGYVVTPTLTTITASSANMAGGGDLGIAEGATITGATSGATAVLTRVVLQDGALADGDASGYLIFASQTGTFQAEKLNVGANLNVGTIAGNSSAITLQPSGRVKTFINNFGGTTATRRIYGCDGVNPGFEFDGTVYAPIRTGMTTDTPSSVFCHKSHLFFSFGASVQHSGTTLPYQWSPVVGAGEIGVGDDVTGFSTEMGSEAGAALGILSRNSVHVLYGNNDTDWNLIKYRDEIGAFENSIQNIGYTVMMDDSGITSLRAVNAFGNFSGNSLSALIQPWIKTRQSTITDSCIVRAKNQYRAFFADETAVYMTFAGNKIAGLMTQLLLHKVECMHSVEGESGSEEIFFGSDDGYCYQMEKGTSFDGTAIESIGMVEYYHCGSPRVNKTFKGATVEATGSSYASFSLGYELGYSSEDIHQPTSQASAADFAAAVNFLESRWDVGNWDNGYWDGVSISPSNFKLVGTAENIAFIFYSSSETQNPIHFSGVMTRFLPRRILR